MGLVETEGFGAEYLSHLGALGVSAGIERIDGNSKRRISFLLSVETVNLCLL